LEEKHMKIDPDCRYRSSHEYARQDGADYVVGISDHAQEALGDIVFVELAEVGKTVAQGDGIGVIESVKAASDIYAPLSGKITAVNTGLQGDPALVNRDCYGLGWLVRMAPSAAGEWEGLLDAAAYEKETGKE
jgi:glycine cleavage system H protein